LAVDLTLNQRLLVNVCM